MIRVLDDNNCVVSGNYITGESEHAIRVSEENTTIADTCQMVDPSKHQCPNDPMTDMFHQMIAGDGGPYEAGCWDLPCMPRVEFNWDMWMTCDIKCLHGTASGVACGINFIESFTRAVEKFNALDHSVEPEKRGDDEDHFAYFKRCESKRYAGITPAPTNDSTIAGT